MSITYHERPGVYVEYDTLRRSAANAGRVAGIAALGTGSGLYRFASAEAALTAFPASTDLGRMLSLAFGNGASTVLCCPVTADYGATFALLLPEADVIATDCRDAETLAALAEALCAEGAKECIAVADSDESVANLCALAQSLNCERLVLTRECGSAGLAAAALAGLICAGDDPALPLSGAALAGLEGTDTPADSEVDTLVRAGVTPLEAVGGSVRVVRAVTTRTMTGGVADDTWRELSTVLIVDDVIPAVRDALKAKFLRRKNTAVTRNAIRAQTAILLDDRVRREIIEGYDSLRAEPVAGDPTACEVSFSFRVVQGLLRIHLYAHILV